PLGRPSGRPATGQARHDAGTDDGGWRRQGSCAVSSLSQLGYRYRDAAPLPLVSRNRAGWSSFRPRHFGRHRAGGTGHVDAGRVVERSKMPNSRQWSKEPLAGPPRFVHEVGRHGPRIDSTYFPLKTHVAASCAWRYVGTTTVSTSPSDRRQPCHFTQLSICIPATACWPSWMARAKRCCSVDDPTICRDCLVIWHRTGKSWSAWRWNRPTTGTGWSMG